MPIDLELELQNGWKTARSQQNKRGQVLVIKFTDRKTKNILFEYAPTNEHLDIFVNEVIPIVNHLESIKTLMKQSCQTKK